MKLGRLRDLVWKGTEVWDAERWAVEGVLHGADRGAIATLLRGLLTPLAWLHRIGLEVYLLPYHLGIRQRCRLPVRVISIGNLSSGGTGKTPTAALVAGYLRQRGKRVVLLSRGHRGSGEGGGAPRVVSDGTQILLGPDEAGDEPVLLAQLLPGIPVVVCRDRRKGGRLAVERFAPDVIVLDDGLQYWQLARDLDVVLLDARRPLDNGWVLPRGLLREPPNHLKRAGVILLTRADRVADAHTLEATKNQVRSLARPHVPVLLAAHSPVGWVEIGGENTELPLDILRNRAVLVVTGIADATAFVQTVAKIGVRIAAIRAYGDHHAYTAPQLEWLLSACGREVVVVTTEKDAVKMAALFALPPRRVYALRIRLQVSDENILKELLDKKPE